MQGSLPTADSILKEVMAKIPSCQVSMRVCEESPTGMSYVLEGFYKSGEIVLIPEPLPEDRSAMDIVFVAHQRYGEKTGVSSFNDLVFLNVHWFMASCKSTWKKMNPEWEKYALEMGLIERKEEIKYHYRYPGGKWIDVG